MTATATTTVLGLLLVTTGATTLGALLPRRDRQAIPAESTLDDTWRSVRHTLPGTAINYVPRGVCRV